MPRDCRSLRKKTSTEVEIEKMVAEERTNELNSRVFKAEGKVRDAFDQ